MRLFIAICLPDNILNALQKTMQGLRAKGVRGNYSSRRDNLHLTLAFLGEVGSPERIFRTMREVSAPEMKLMLQGSGRFRDLYWIGLAENQELTRYAAALREALGSAGIDYDSNPYLRCINDTGRQIMGAFMAACLHRNPLVAGEGVNEADHLHICFC